MGKESSYLGCIQVTISQEAIFTVLLWRTICSWWETEAMEVPMSDRFIETGKHTEWKSILP